MWTRHLPQTGIWLSNKVYTKGRQRIPEGFPLFTVLHTTDNGYQLEDCIQFCKQAHTLPFTLGLPHSNWRVLPFSGDLVSAWGANSWGEGSNVEDGVLENPPKILPTWASPTTSPRILPLHVLLLAVLWKQFGKLSRWHLTFRNSKCLLEGVR